MNNIPVREVDEDLVLEIGIADLTLYSGHLDDGYSDQNDNSLISVLELNDFSVMFTGDISSKAEGVFIDIYPLVTADILSVPHHGSKYSSSAKFLQSVSPCLSIISVSADNSYGHPTPEALGRLSKYGEVLTTKDCGTIRIVSDGYDYEIYTENE
jgi:competence protein ComEC